MPQAIVIACPGSIDLGDIAVFARDLAAARGMSFAMSDQHPTGDGRAVHVSHPAVRALDRDPEWDWRLLR